MNDIVATEVIEKPAARTLVETWGKNERMRHIPPIDWMVQKIDGDLRPRINALHAAFAALPGGDSRWQAVEAQLRALCRSLERLGETARHGRQSTQPPAELAARIESALGGAITALRLLDPALFGRRYAFQTFERSRAEPVYAALLVAIDYVHRITVAIRGIAPGIDEQLLPPMEHRL